MSIFLASIGASNNEGCCVKSFGLVSEILFPNKSFCAFGLGLASVTLKSSPKTRRPMVLNSSSAKRGSNSSRLGASRISLSSSKAIGTSKIMVANFFETKPCAAKFSTFSFCFPFSSCTLAMIFSILPYCLMSAFAVFSPMPGIPGILSTASPQSPKISIT